MSLNDESLFQTIFFNYFMVFRSCAGLLTLTIATLMFAWFCAMASFLKGFSLSKLELSFKGGFKEVEL